MNTKIRFFYLCSVFSVLFILSACDSGPAASLFKGDLKVNVIYEDTKNLAVNNVVYMEDAAEKTVIGFVKKIKQTEEGNKLVNLIIEHDYRDMIFSNTMFVLNSSLFANESPGILAATIPSELPAAPLESGDVVKGVTYTEYSLAMARKGTLEFIDAASAKAKEYFENLKTYSDEFDMDEFMSQLRETARAVGDFSKEQKEKFVKEILPEIERLMEDAKKNLDQNGSTKDKQQLEKEYEKLKDNVEI